MIVKRNAEGWRGVAPEGYVPGERTQVVRHTLVGARKTRREEPGPDLEMRYFELPPGTCSRFEKHEHEHYVVVGEGEGHAIVGTTVEAVGPRDVVYVGPLVPHQFVNRGEAPFGFFCVVSTVRDHTQKVSPEELAEIMASPAGAYVDPDGAPPPRYVPPTTAGG